MTPWLLLNGKFHLPVRDSVSIFKLVEVLAHPVQSLPEHILTHCFLFFKPGRDYS